MTEQIHEDSDFIHQMHKCEVIRGQKNTKKNNGLFFYPMKRINTTSYVNILHLKFDYE